MEGKVSPRSCIVGNWHAHLGEDQEGYICWPMVTIIVISFVHYYLIAQALCAKIVSWEEWINLREHIQQEHFLFILLDGAVRAP